jgi:thiopeptide-type bacteriocin biosynthesis protein
MSPGPDPPPSRVEVPAAEAFEATVFVLRTPLLPFDELLAWGEGLTAPDVLAAPSTPDDRDLAAALAADRALLRSRLAALIARPEVAEALFLASPSLYQDLGVWQSAPESKTCRRVELSLVRYLYRLTARATPFGLFAGFTLGPVGTPTRLTLGPRAGYRRHTRLDLDFLFALATELGRDPALRRELRYHPNSSLHLAAGRRRYVEARLRDGVRSHHLVAVDETPYLAAALGCPQGAQGDVQGAHLAEIAAAVAAADPDGEIGQDEAEEFVTELIDRQLLISDLEPPVTGLEPMAALRRVLAGIPAGAAVAHQLDQVQEDLDRLDRPHPPTAGGGLGVDLDRYREIAGRLTGLPVEPRLDRLFQVDLSTSAGALSLGPEVAAELARGAEVLSRLFSSARLDPLRTFRESFVARYGEDREVPLLAVLDSEMGIGFGSQGHPAGPQGEASPLLHGIALPGAPAPVPVRWSRSESWLLARLEETWRRGERELVITDGDLPALASEDPLPLPDAFHATAVLAAPSAEALAAGDFRLLLFHASGPSGVRMIGRFCHGDPTVRAAVEAHLRAEEALDPQAAYAELVYLPEGRVGNVLCRPVLRDWEIPYLGRSGAPPERQIPAADLRLRVMGNAMELRSERLGRRVVPCLTNAHNFDAPRTSRLYRFLCHVQRQGLAHGVQWMWGEIARGARFTPRVRLGRLILARAAWRLPGDEIKALAAAASATERYRAVQAWRERHGLPRHVVLVESDRELLVDLGNPLSADSLVDRLGESKEAQLLEAFPDPAELCARGPEGVFVHELIVPFVRRAPRPRPSPPPPASVPASFPRTFPPGSAWFYAKLYTGPAGADRVLRELVAPLRRRALAEGWADGWFFLRYGDPDWHVRLRFHGEPRRLAAELGPALADTAAPLLADGTLWKVQLDTYEREVERYGGPAGVALAERLFEADSEAVLALLAAFEGDAGAAARWQLTLLGIDRWLDDLGLDLGLDLDRRLAVVRAQRDGLAAELGGGKELRLSLDRKFRAERTRLTDLLTGAIGDGDGDDAWERGRAVFRRRAERTAAPLAELATLEADGRLAIPRADLAASLVHLHANRMLRAGARAQELVLYDLLARLYASRASRQARGGPSEALLT